MNSTSWHGASSCCRWRCDYTELDIWKVGQGGVKMLECKQSACYKILHRALDLTGSYAWGNGPSTSMTFGYFLISSANIRFFKGNVLHNLRFQLTN